MVSNVMTFFWSLGSCTKSFKKKLGLLNVRMGRQMVFACCSCYQALFDNPLSIQLQELLLAEEWAKHRNIPFPKIEPTIYDREGIKECYVFDDDDQPDAPIVLHFMLASVNFKRFSAPGMAVVLMIGLKGPRGCKAPFAVFF